MAKRSSMFWYSAKKSKLKSPVSSQLGSSAVWPFSCIYCDSKLFVQDLPITSNSRFVFLLCIHKLIFLFLKMDFGHDSICMCSFAVLFGIWLTFCSSFGALMNTILLTLTANSLSTLIVVNLVSYSNILLYFLFDGRRYCGMGEGERNVGEHVPSRWFLRLLGQIHGFIVPTRTFGIPSSSQGK